MGASKDQAFPLQGRSVSSSEGSSLKSTISAYGANVHFALLDTKKFSK
jgi:hypothetical protein